MRTRSVLSPLFASLAITVLCACGHGGPGKAIAIAAAPAEDFVAPAAGVIERDTAREALALLARSSAALRAGRLIAPVGDNALEWGLKAHAAAPHNRAVQQQLADISPYAASAIDGAIRSGDLAEAERVLGLLAQANGESLAVHQLRESLRLASAKASADATRKDAALTRQTHPAATQIPDMPADGAERETIASRNP